MADFVIVGSGYVGTRLAAALPGPVVAVTRSGEAAHRLRQQGIGSLACDLDRLAAAGRFPAGCHQAVVFYLAPPPGTGPADPRLARWLASLDAGAPPARIVYMSTTGVYGDAAGGRVDETSATRPALDRARARLDAENTLRQWCEAHGVAWTVLRVPGIYGPDRLPLERLQRGEPVIAEQDAGPGNRIHVDDLVRACVAAGTAAVAANRVYNVGDGNHASATAYFNLVARLAGLPAPPALPRAEAQRRLSPLAWSFLGDSRLVDTSRMERELAVEIRYRNLEDGIRASLPSQVQRGP